jgi:hypothetical protein
MNETPDLLWLALTTLGVLGLGGMIFYAMPAIELGKTGAATPAQRTDPKGCHFRTIEQIGTIEYGVSHRRC